MQLESCYYTEPSTHSGLQRLIVEFSFKRVINHLRYFCVFQRIFIQWQCLWKKCFCHCFSIAIGMATAIEDAKPCPLLWRAATLITDCERIVRIWFRQLAFAQKLRFTLKKEPCTLYRNYRTGFGIFCSCLTFLPFISKSFFYLMWSKKITQNLDGQKCVAAKMLTRSPRVEFQICFKIRVLKWSRNSTIKAPVIFAKYFLHGVLVRNLTFFRTNTDFRFFFWLFTSCT